MVHFKNTRGTSIITTILAETQPALGLIPGERLCQKCKRMCYTAPEATSSVGGAQESSPNSDPSDPEVAAEGIHAAHSDPSDPDVAGEDVNETLAAIGVSPVRRKRGRKSRELYARKKVKRLQKSTEKQVYSYLGLQQPSTSAGNFSDEFPTQDYITLMEQLKEKYASEEGRQKKIQILTLAPMSWSREKIMTYFGASERQAREAMRVRTKDGVLATPSRKAGRPISEKAKSSIRQFYEDDSVSYCLPGKKDVIRGHQKRLLLLNLRELYEEWKKSCPLKCGFSSFAALRPPHCVLAGGSGTHTVCVCMAHQNFKLMLNAVGLKQTAEELMSTLVCNIENEDCMRNRCPACPSKDALQMILESALDTDEVDDLRVEHWIAGVRCRLEIIILTPAEYSEKFLDAIEELKLHHFVSKQQAKYLKELKTSLKDDEMILLLDFAENYSFLVQDAPQSYHWVNTQATIHPFVAYHRSEETRDLCVKSLAVISDCLDHTTTAVATFQAEALKVLKQELPSVRKIHYFSDGASSQYKNKKNFVNLCCHESDFNLSAEWNFFATSHGKSACDGVGGTVKRLAARASLQRPYQGQILTPHQLFTWAENNIKGIRVLWVPERMVEEKQEQLSRRFESAIPLKGTRTFHHFVPSSLTTVNAGLTSYSATQTFQVAKHPHRRRR